MADEPVVPAPEPAKPSLRLVSSSEPPPGYSGPASVVPATVPSGAGQQDLFAKPPAGYREMTPEERATFNNQETQLALVKAQIAQYDAEKKLAEMRLEQAFGRLGVVQAEAVEFGKRLGVSGDPSALIIAPNGKVYVKIVVPPPAKDEKPPAAPANPEEKSPEPKA